MEKYMIVKFSGSIKDFRNFIDEYLCYCWFEFYGRDTIGQKILPRSGKEIS